MSAWLRLIQCSYLAVSCSLLSDLLFQVSCGWYFFFLLSSSFYIVPFNLLLCNLSFQGVDDVCVRVFLSIPFLSSFLLFYFRLSPLLASSTSSRGGVWTVERRRVLTEVRQQSFLDRALAVLLIDPKLL